MTVKKRVPPKRASSALSRRCHSPGAPVPSSGHERQDPQLVEGIALYNHRRFFECHEVLEQRWLQTTDASKDFYKGLIQAAVAFYHWSRGNLPGALTLARSAARYLKRYRPACAGVDVEGFLTQFTELFQWLRRHRQRYDPRLVPAIRFVASRSVTQS